MTTRDTERLARLRELELFYNGPIPEQELAALRIALVAPTPETLRAAMTARRADLFAAIKWARTAPGEYERGNAVLNVGACLRLYRRAQAEYRTAMDDRWKARLGELRHAAE